MDFKQVKKASEIALEGIAVDMESADGSLRTITLTDGKGGVLRVMRVDYSMQAYVPAPPKMVKKWALTGKYAGLVDVSETFDTKYDADDRLREYRRKNAGGDDEIGLSVSEVEVPE